MGSYDAETCKNNHAMTGDNLVLKARRRYVSKDKTYIWTERCCKACYNQWRYEYEIRKFGYSRRSPTK